LVESRDRETAAATVEAQGRCLAPARSKKDVLLVFSRVSPVYGEGKGRTGLRICRRVH